MVRLNEVYDGDYDTTMAKLDGSARKYEKLPKMPYFDQFWPINDDFYEINFDLFLTIVDFGGLEGFGGSIWRVLRRVFLPSRRTLA